SSTARWCTAAGKREATAIRRATGRSRHRTRGSSTGTPATAATSGTRTTGRAPDREGSRANNPSACHLPAVALPPNALAKLAAAKLEAEIRALSLGDVWWLPKEYVDYAKPEKDRYCLLVALEPKGGGLPARAHFVAGTTKGATGPALAVVAWEVGTGEDT